MKKLFLSLFLTLTAAGAANAIIDSYTINREQLPDQAKEMLDEYFPKAKIGMIKIDRHLLKKTDYDVRLVNGTTIEFSNSGKWTSVDCKNKEVPEGLVMKTIRNYIAKNFKGTKITKITKKTTAYEIGLSDGVELTFNLLGQFKKAKIED
ncbi:MAG: PepSY-like domain-containing protein [Staphylococcus sp.]|nr:PepSY-like domain-containing protein [Staphylococcus sp.]